MSELQFYTLLILFALIVSISLQAFVLQGRKRFFACIAVLLVVVISLVCWFYTGNFKTESVTNESIKKVETLVKTDSRNSISALDFKEISKEFFDLKNTIESPIPELFNSDVEQETFARKALSIREKANTFYQKNYNQELISQENYLNQEFQTALEHLRAAAFAFYAEASSDDKSFKNFQSLQKKDQLEKAVQKFSAINDFMQQKKLQTTTNKVHL